MRGASKAKINKYAYAFETLACELQSDVLEKMRPFLAKAETVKEKIKDKYVPCAAVFVQKEAFWDSCANANASFADSASSKSTSASGSGSVGGFGCSGSAGYEKSSTDQKTKNRNEAEANNRAVTITRGNLTLAILLVKKLVAEPQGENSDEPQQ